MIRSLVEPQHLAAIFGVEKFRCALGSLLESSVYAELTNCDPWEFAVEAPYLMERGLSPSDLRFLVRIQMLDHAHEINSPHCTSRQFRRRQRFSITKRTCFVLSSQGVEAALAYGDKLESGDDADGVLNNGQPAVHTSLPAKPLPIWEADRRLLTYDGKIVKRFKCRALNQEKVLNAFQEENWPYRILDPLAPHPSQHAKRRLSDTIKCLNRGRENNLIRFRGDGTGQGVVWESAFNVAGVADCAR